MLAREATKLFRAAQSLVEIVDVLNGYRRALDLVAVSAAFVSITTMKCSTSERQQILEELSKVALSQLPVMTVHDLKAAALIMRYSEQLRYYNEQLVSALLAECVDKHNLGDLMILSTVLYGTSRMADGRRGQVPGVTRQLMEEWGNTLVSKCCQFAKDPATVVDVREIDQTLTSCDMLRLQLSAVQFQALIRACLREFSTSGLNKHAAGILASSASMGLLPAPSQLQQLFKYSIKGNGHDMHTTTSTIANVFAALGTFARKVPGGLDAMAQYQEVYALGCEELLGMVKLMAPGRIQGRHIGIILRNVACLATTSPAIIDKASAVQWVQGLWELAHLPHSKALKTPLVSTMAAVCEAIVSLDLRDLAPAVVKSCKAAGAGLELESSGARATVLHHHGSTLWEAHCWLVRQGQKGGWFTAKQLHKLRGAAAGSAAAAEPDVLGL